MTGETDLAVLLRTMTPSLIDGELVFCSLTEEHFAHLRLRPVCTFREREGMTVILLRDEAEHHALPFTFPCRQITLTVHSSLHGVGLLAMLTAKLAAAHISVNVVSAYYHDHLFVPSSDADRALELLRTLQESFRNEKRAPGSPSAL